VTTSAIAHLMLMTAHSGQADFGPADAHATEAARIADRYDLPAIATRVSVYRAMRAAIAGDPAAHRLYQQSAAQLGRLGMWRHGAVMHALGRLSLHITRDRAADSADELARIYAQPPWAGLLSELYALALADSGRLAEAREVAGQPVPIRRDMFWLFVNGVRAMLAIAISDRDRAGSAYEALVPFAGRPAGADTGAVTLWPTALILGDLAQYLGRPGARAHYEHALAVAGQAGVPPWAEAARARLATTSGG
jgi:hypothetical protein